MAVYRVNKNRGYTVMANYHLRDKTLSLKAVGLLSKMLSFNDGWQFSTKGLSAICKEGPDAVLAALRELEDHGYLIRHRQRDAKGRMSNTVFEIYEQPQPVSPHRENPDVDISAKRRLRKQRGKSLLSGNISVLRQRASLSGKRRSSRSPTMSVWSDGYEV